MNERGEERRGKGGKEEAEWRDREEREPYKHFGNMILPSVDEGCGILFLQLPHLNTVTIHHFLAQENFTCTLNRDSC